MKTIAVLLITLFQLAYGADFYATKELQEKYPRAFASHPSSLPFHQELNQQNDRDDLIQDIQEDPALTNDIIHFNHLSLDRQVEVLKELFELECKNLKITAPDLIIDEHSIPGWAFFEFDFAKGGAGKVYLNKAKLESEKNPSEFIILLLHETRHSAQFQLAQKSPMSSMGMSYVAAFTAQKELKTKGIKTSFCDFMLLINEYEAFQFANYVHGALTDFQTPINDMGTLASQYDSKGRVRLDLIHVLTQTNRSPLELFNELSFTQYEVMYE